MGPEWRGVAGSAAWAGAAGSVISPVWTGSSADGRGLMIFRPRAPAMVVEVCMVCTTQMEVEVCMVCTTQPNGG
eukprot:356116-Chlamydomonas_euryale.AAC.1